MEKSKPTLVLGASIQPYRYSYLAIQQLRDAGHPVFAIGRYHAWLHDVEIVTEPQNWPEVHTVTLYLHATHQVAYEGYLLSLCPQRVIFNPGAENMHLERKLRAAGIETLRACTLVMLSTGQY